MKKNTDLALLIIRLTVSLLMLTHGIAKLQHGVDMIGQMLTSKGLPSFIAYGVIVGEVLAPILIIVGFRTRIAAGILLFNMIVAIEMAESGDLFKFTKHGSLALEIHWFYVFSSLALMISGAGKYALSTRNKWD